tara:strand:- start:294 stop:836 length:543 start_codon:yes stop_codon:yes gene_type:complete
MLKGKEIAIRPVKKADLNTLLTLMNDMDSIGNYLPNTFLSESRFIAEYEATGMLSDASSRYVIVDTQDEIIGLIWSFKSIPYFDAFELGYRIFANRNRGKGFASEALRLLCQYLFEAKSVNRLELRMAVENSASEKVAIRGGFSLEGTHRQAAFSKGRLYDMHTYALLRSEWAEKASIHL